MEPTQIRPGRVPDPPTESLPRVVAVFRNSAQGNAVIQFLMTLGIPGDRLGVIPPERTPRGQGMVLAIACPDAALMARVEDVCRAQGASIHRSPGGPDPRDS